MLVHRFLEFKGCGQKISTMAVNILVRHYKIKLSDYKYIDISVDTHVNRIMKRMGLIDIEDPLCNESLSIVYKCRDINPEYQVYLILFYMN